MSGPSIGPVFRRPMLEAIEGTIESITYSNPETGYTIAKIKVDGQRETITVLGTLLSPVPGETITMQGEWSRHPRFGRQFKVQSFETSTPATVKGIENYLGSGLVRGIGPETARRIVRHFGEETLQIIDEKPERLTEVAGIGRKRVAMIRRAWDEQKEIRGVMIFLQSYGVSPAYAARIFKTYGKHTVQVVQENPYRLAEDVFGIGFLTADKIAANLGISRDSRERAEAGILHVLKACVDEGHVCYPLTQLAQKSQQVLEIDREIIARALDSLRSEEKVAFFARAEKETMVYLPAYYVAESGAALLLQGILDQPRAMRRIEADKAIAWVQARLEITLAVGQVEAVRAVIEEKALVITGGPGTGKTTIIKAMIAVFSRAGARILLAAPTGRAAKRMSEASGHEASTIHRLLEYNPRGGFVRDQHHPLDCDVLIIDEASMIDSILIYHLLKAVPPAALLVLVGDIHQLPSVGAGTVLQDIIASGKVRVVELNEIFRQARESRIIVNAHRIHVGLAPTIDQESGEAARDFFFIRQDDPDRVVRLIIELVSVRIPRRFHLDPVEDIQVLSPMHRGAVGVVNLNRELQQALNPAREQLQRQNKLLKTGDKVMQIRNDYKKDVFNGDIGRIVQIDQKRQTVQVSFDGRQVLYRFEELDQLELAYAVSVHKSQGSEYPAVIVPVMTQHYLLLQRNLLYTAVTRGKKLVVLIGTTQALNIAVKNDKTMRRHSLLAERLIV